MSTGIEAFFAPRTVAVIGASRHRGKLGHEVLRDSAARGFAGAMYGVNPRHEGGEIAGWPVRHSVADIGERIDLALVAVPAQATLDAVSACARAGVRAAVLAAAGLGELDAAGRSLEATIAGVAADAGMRLLGPNGFGLFVAGIGLNLTTWTDIPAGRVALLTQSGNVAIALFGLAAQAGIGFASCAGLGNQLDIGAAEMVGYHADSRGLGRHRALRRRDRRGHRPPAPRCVARLPGGRKAGRGPEGRQLTAPAREPSPPTPARSGVTTGSGTPYCPRPARFASSPRRRWSTCSPRSPCCHRAPVGPWCSPTGAATAC